MVLHRQSRRATTAGPSDSSSPSSGAGLSPGPPPPGPGLRTNQIYFAHLAVTDVAGRRHEFFERWSRGAAGLAGADRGAVRGLARGLAGRRREPRTAARCASGRRMGTRESTSSSTRPKPLVLHGDRGLSPKSAEPGNASYYVGYTRMTRAGARVGAGGPPAAVRGTAWFDHEWSTSALGPGAVGWDWFSLQLGDERELMFFVIRREDGTRRARVRRAPWSRRTAGRDDWARAKSRSRCSTVGRAPKAAPSIRCAGASCRSPRAGPRGRPSPGRPGAAHFVHVLGRSRDACGERAAGTPSPAPAMSR